MEDMTDDEVWTMLRGVRFGHLALADGGRAYSIPIFYGTANDVVYIHSLPGAKDAWIRATKEACLTVTRAESEDRWASVIVRGPIEEVTMDKEVQVAMEALMAVPPPPAEGTTGTGEPRRGGPGLTYRKLTPVEVAGRKSVPPPADLVETV